MGVDSQAATYILFRIAQSPQFDEVPSWLAESTFHAHIYLFGSDRGDFFHRDALFADKKARIFGAIHPERITYSVLQSPLVPVAPDVDLHIIWEKHVVPICGFVDSKQPVFEIHLSEESIEPHIARA